MDGTPEQAEFRPAAKAPKILKKKRKTLSKKGTKKGVVVKKLFHGVGSQRLYFEDSLQHCQITKTQKAAQFALTEAGHDGTVTSGDDQSDGSLGSLKDFLVFEDDDGVDSPEVNGLLLYAHNTFFTILRLQHLPVARHAASDRNW